MKPPRIWVILYVTGLLLASLLAHRFWVQYRTLKVVVGLQRPLSPYFRAILHQSDVSATNVLTYEDGVPYNEAYDKKVSASDLASIRRAMAWRFVVPFDVELVVIHDPRRVTIHVRHKRFASVTFIKVGDCWTYKLNQGNVQRINMSF